MLPKVADTWFFFPGDQVLSPTSGSMDYALSLRPEYHQAILDVIAHYGWKSIVYIYDSHDGQSPTCPHYLNASHSHLIFNGRRSFDSLLVFFQWLILNF